jgi:formate-dependent nitrite reductase cytochrome c552 subunit
MEDITVKLRVPMILAGAACATGLLVWLGFPQTAGGDPLQDTAGKPAEEKYSYVGSKSCKKCHIKLYKSWEATKSAKAFETLKPGQAAEAKKKHGLDPEKDYTKDESCLKCHVTGFGKKGGYAIPDAADEKAVKEAAALEGSGCESCHGPGSAYIEVFQEINKSKRMYKVDELYAAGLHKMGPPVCAECHNDKSPTYTEEKKLDYAKAKDRETHEHSPLKQREE